MVDDEVMLTRMTKRTLEATGRFDVMTENNPESAVGTARSFQPDVILLDVMMPRCDGGEVAGRFLKDSKLKDVPIIFLTAAVKQQEVKGGAASIGGRLYLPKPVRAPELIEQIEKAVGSAGS
jgi:CheY-like chemotaxis protein